MSLSPCVRLRRGRWSMVAPFHTRAICKIGATRRSSFTTPCRRSCGSLVLTSRSRRWRNHRQAGLHVARLLRGPAQSRAGSRFLVDVDAC
ncbi:hypothetical protein Hsc_3924 [Herbaspirillum seropedicae]|nr:hypothetical protein Hsc_3924 [Herbaspirillum seropedicae]